MTGRAEKDIVDTLVSARNVSTPVVGLMTPDQHALVDRICSAIPSESPKVQWDACRGLVALNDAGAAAVAGLDMPPDELASQSRQPDVALQLADKFPRRSLLLMWNAHRHIADPIVAQAVANLRNRYKADGRMLVLMGPDMPLPSELRHDVVVLDEQLPDDAALAGILKALYKDGGVDLPKSGLEPAVAAVRGLSAFEAETIAAMSMRKSGLRLDELWDRKRVAINTRGIELVYGRDSLDDLRGLPSISGFARQLAAGPVPPEAVFHLDEIEKMLGGTGHGRDTSGVSDDQHGVILREMEDNGWSGVILYGPPGTGKSHFARGLAGTMRVPLLSGDLGATKGEYVGQSERGIRDMMKVVKAVGRNRVLVVGTANRLDSLSPELRRRFWMGIWFFDLPSAEERAAIWALHRERRGIEDAELPDDAGWTGAEIRNCCELAYRLNCGLVEASRRIVPVSKADPDSIKKARQLAEGRFLSAQHEGAYRADRPEAALRGGRDLSQMQGAK